MQTLHWADHIVVAIFAVGIGINGYLHIGEFLRKVAAGDPHVRRSEYRWTMLIQWVVTAAALFVWFGLADGRTLDDLGLGWNSHWHSWLGVGLTVAACSFFALQLFLARSNDEARSSLREQFDPASQMLPHTAAEVRLFAGVALTAGVCEEILFRGYLLAYLEFFMPTWLAATLAVLAFGLAHSYLAVLTKGQATPSEPSSLAPWPWLCIYSQARFGVQSPCILPWTCSSPALPTCSTLHTRSKTALRPTDANMFAMRPMTHVLAEVRL